MLHKHDWTRWAYIDLVVDNVLEDYQEYAQQRKCNLCGKLDKRTIQVVQHNFKVKK